MRVLISVSDKTGVVEFAQKLCDLGAEIISTGGTATLLHENNIAVTTVTELTNFPEIMGGRVKTLHPYIYAGILARKNVEQDKHVLQQFGIEEFNLVVVNLYPFVKTLENPAATEQEIIENIDIGGPCMIRAAAKNYNRVAVVVNPDDYVEVIDNLQNAEELPLQQRFSISEYCF